MSKATYYDLTSNYNCSQWFTAVCSSCRCRCGTRSRCRCVVVVVVVVAGCRGPRRRASLGGLRGSRGDWGPLENRSKTRVWKCVAVLRKCVALKEVRGAAACSSEFPRIIEGLGLLFSLVSTVLVRNWQVGAG